MSKIEHKSWKFPLILLVLLSLLLVACTTTAADDSEEVIAQQDDSTQEAEATEIPEGSIEFAGVITSVNANLIVVNGLTVNIGEVDIDDDLEVDDTVEVVGVLDDGIVIAIVIIVLDDPEMTPEATAAPENTPDPEATTDPEMTPEPETTPDPDDDDGDIVIVIEGPVEAINVNIITIFGFDIELEPDDPVLTVIQIGDVIRIEGDFDDDSAGTTIVIIAINIIFVDIDVFVLDGEVWRDSGNCQNPPPPWAPANGWRRRCQSGGGSSGGSGRGRGGSGSS